MMTKVDQNWWTLRVLFGAMGIASGLDKFTNLLVFWPRYLWDVAPSLLNVAPQTFMYGVGVIEIAVGIAIFTRYTKIAGYILSAWLLAIALNLLIVGFYDIAVRDVGLAIGAFVMANLAPTPDVQARQERAHVPV